MNWERGYDKGYYEGMRNCIATLITLRMNGSDLNEIIKQLATLRDVARENVEGDDLDA